MSDSHSAHASIANIRVALSQTKDAKESISVRMVYFSSVFITVVLCKSFFKALSGTNCISESCRIIMDLISARRDLGLPLRISPLGPGISSLLPVSLLRTLLWSCVTFIKDDVLSLVCLRAGLRLWIVDVLANEERLSLVNLRFLSESEEKLRVVVIVVVVVFFRNRWGSGSSEELSGSSGLTSWRFSS